MQAAILVLMQVTEFRLKLYPKDFLKVREFYEKTLGFAVIGEWDRDEQDQGVMFQVGTSVLELLSPEKEFRPITGTGLSLEVLDVRELWAHLKDKAPVVFELRDNSWGDTSFCVTDPEGFELTFFEKDK
jgi:uncharacterized glyoxalase superfamily protein PhnB